MCRWILYAGPELRLSELLTEPEHSLIHQSYKAELREEPLNGDGFGVAWYARALREEPALFRSVRPAWNNLSLHSVAGVVKSDVILAHVRAATVGKGVGEANCHPFVAGPLSFMHNGTVHDFDRVKRPLVERLSDESYGDIDGSTDTEHVFGLFRDRYRETPGEGPERLAAALTRTIADVTELVEEAGAAPGTTLNLAVSDGRTSVVSRYAHGEGMPANSLFVSYGRRYECRDGVSRMIDDDSEGTAAVVASEPLSDDFSWTEVPHNSLALVDEARDVEIRPIE